MREDRISELPNDILISIISRLNVQEAVSTSILSTRWRHLQHHYLDLLVFRKFRCGIDRIPNYVHMVDHVLNSNRSSQIKVLGVDMSRYVGAKFKKWLKFEEWFEFALAKKIEIIHLRGVEQHHHKGPIFRLPSTNGLECIKDLYLASIKLSDQGLEFLVSNCVALERLKIESSWELRNVSIVGHSKLKLVNISRIWGAESIVIRDTISLVFLMIHGLSRECAVELSNIPKLTKLDFKESGDQPMLADLLASIPFYIRHRLQLLHFLTPGVHNYVSPSKVIFSFFILCMHMSNLNA